MTHRQTMIKILLVEDHAVLRRVIRTLLEKDHRYEVCGEAATPATALQMARETKPRIAVVDLSLPEGNGLDLITALKKEWPDLPVLLLTGWGESLLRTHVTETPPDAVLGKPINQSDLLNAVAAVLRGRSEQAPTASPSAESA